MPSLKSLLFPTLLSLAAIATAAEETCPNDWYPNTFHGTRCCYGHMTIQETDAFCCVPYPIVPGEVLASLEDSISAPEPCFTLVPFTASDYSERVSAASASAMTATKPSTNEATPTPTGTGSGSGSGMEPTGTSTGAAMPVATAQGMVLGGAAVAAALLAL
ncbi:hypothetical protein FQN55_009227 [Onygenales sp. PD_40]|nr:hypothetical protein FQN55_009227 [Onygenales sp. PD_40]KAK2792966.1 hypothetical protein FQN51_001371 [Onygenales sp. PD_10]